ncbi:MAG: cytochrome c-type biogenesis protein CcmH [Candidatus Methanoperedens sp.]|nr:cytochrome c-type biogenesis protein CcmH [Candidatus Methanoperedens sp.]
MFKIIILLILISGIFLVNPVMADQDMTSHLICPCECAMVISTCGCSTAIQVKKEILQMKEAGFSENQMFSALQTEYGMEILAHPEKVHSIPLWVAGVPLALIFVFLGFILIKKPNPDIIPVSNKKYEKRFEEEYRKFVSEIEEM